MNLQWLHYVISTNIGLLQVNMSYMYTTNGPTYHWMLELHNHLGLPIYEKYARVSPE